MPQNNPVNLRCTISERDCSALHAPIAAGPSIDQVIARLDAAGSGCPHPADVPRGPYKPRGSAALKAQVVALERQVRAMVGGAA